MNSLSDSAKPARADTVLVLDDDVLVRMPICAGPGPHQAAFRRSGTIGRKVMPQYSLRMRSGGGLSNVPAYGVLLRPPLLNVA